MLALLTRHLLSTPLSSAEGAFTETWQLFTEPPLLPSASPITLHFSGVSYRSDEGMKNQRSIVEQIQRQVTVEITREVVKDVVNSIAWKKPLIHLRNGDMTVMRCFGKYNPGVILCALSLSKLRMDIQMFIFSNMDVLCFLLF
ncbi:unnamed protein product [Rodentolepis nana]|uniref:Ig-like domain-containing protein n=1 Tax=Rodentolepis nana TaxID=102285 RepID=A0A0R3TD22_RODNA|nr:unnamed protein product [Rodentolepis nana]